jgi:hypothetical protein
MAMDDAPDDGLLRRYVLGRTTAGETERIDELSITSEDIAMRLQAVEYDLIDAYVAGELAGDDLQAVQALRSNDANAADWQSEILFARALKERLAGGTPKAKPTPARATTVWKRPPSMSRWTLTFAAIAAMLTLVVVGYLAMANRLLRRDVDVARTERAALEDRARGLQQQLDAQRAAKPESTQTTPTVIASIVLPPLSRGGTGVAGVATVTTPPDADFIRLHAPIGRARYASVTAVLRDAAANQIVWRQRGAASGATETGRESHTVAVEVPATLLRPGTYLLEITGTRAGGGSDTLGPYAFQVVLP